MSLSSQAPLVHSRQAPFMPFRYKYCLVASFKTDLDGKLYKIDYALCPRDAPGPVEVCRTVCPFTKWSQTARLFQALCLFSIIFCLLFCQFIVPTSFPTNSDPRNESPKNQFLFLEIRNSWDLSYHDSLSDPRV